MKRIALIGIVLCLLLVACSPKPEVQGVQDVPQVEPTDGVDSSADTLDQELDTGLDETEKELDTVTW